MASPLEPLAAEMNEPYRALFACRVPRSDGYADSPLIVERLRELGAGIWEEITIRNYSSDSVECLLVFTVESDFADLFEVKEARRLTIRARWEDVRKGVVVKASGADLSPETLTYRTVVLPHGQWSTQLSIVPTPDGAGPAAAFVHPAAGELSPSDRRRQEWVAKIPVVHMGNRSIERTIRRSYDDLGRFALKIPTTRTGSWWPPARPGL